MKSTMENNKLRKRIETDRVGLQLEIRRSWKDTLRWLFSKDVMEVNKTDMQIVFQVEEQQGQRLRDRSVPGMFKELSGSQWSWSGVSKGKSSSTQGQRQARSGSTWALWELWTWWSGEQPEGTGASAMWSDLSSEEKLVGGGEEAGRPVRRLLR